MITEKQYAMILKTTIMASLNAAKDEIINLSDSEVERLMQMGTSEALHEIIAVKLPDPLKFTWQLTRPNARVDIADLSGPLKEQYPHLDTEKHVKTIEVWFVYDENGDPISSFSNCSIHKPHLLDGVDENELEDAVAKVLTDCINESGLLMKHPQVVVDPSGMFKDLVAKHTEDAIVADFTSQMDDIFDTWKGGK